MEKCVVCNVKFEESISIPSFEKEEKLNEKLSFIYRKILRIFCTHFKLPSKHNQNQNQNENQEENGIFGLPLFPFCVECRNLVAELCVFHEKLESIQKIIQKTIAKITTKILQTENDEENCSNSIQAVQNQNEDENKNERNKENEQGQKYRRKIVQNFSPRVLLVKCQNPKPNENENHKPKSTPEPEQTETAERIRINSTTSSGESHALIDQDFHGNESDTNFDDDAAAESEMSQIEETTTPKSSNENSNENENCSSAPAQTSQNLMEKIRSQNTRRNSTLTSVQTSHSKFHEKIKCFDVNSEAKTRNRKKSRSTRKKVTKNQFAGSFRKIGEGKYRYVRGKWSFEKTEFGWKCGNCPKYYKTPRGAQMHMELWHIPGEFACKLCPRSFSRASILKKHLCGFGLEKIGNKQSVEISPGKFLYNGKYEFTKTEDGSFTCSICSATRKAKSWLVAHINSYHDRPKFHCEVCGHVSNTNHELIKHLKIHSEKSEREQFKCSEENCTRIYNTKGQLRQHERKKHNAAPKKPLLEKKFQCEKCLNKFVSLIFLKRHLQSHEKIFICALTQCRERFATFEEMELHYKQHKRLLNQNSDDSEEGESENETTNSTSQENSTGKKLQSQGRRKKKQDESESEYESETQSEDDEEIEEVELSDDEEQNDDAAELTKEESEVESENAD